MAANKRRNFYIAQQNPFGKHFCQNPLLPLTNLLTANFIRCEASEYFPAIFTFPTIQSYTNLPFPTSPLWKVSGAFLSEKRFLLIPLHDRSVKKRPVGINKHLQKSTENVSQCMCVCLCVCERERKKQFHFSLWALTSVVRSWLSWC